MGQLLLDYVRRDSEEFRAALADGHAVINCCSCGMYIDLGVIPKEDFQRMEKVGVKCGDCVTSAVIDYEEGDC